MAPIRRGDGTGIGSIRLGDGTEVNEVRTGDGDTVFKAAPDFVLPSSAIHHWPMSERSDSIVVDSISSLNGTVNGNVQNIAGNWFNGYAEDNPGSNSAYVDIGNFETLAENFTGGYWMAFTLQTTDDGRRLIGRNTTSDRWILIISSGNLLFRIGMSGANIGSNNNGFTTSGPNLSDGSPHRIWFEVIDANSNSYDVYIDGDPVSITTLGSNNINNPSSLNPFYISGTFSSNANHLEQTTDNMVFGLGSESLQVIQDDYNTQPWS